MQATTGHDIIHRWSGNPLITLVDVDFQCIAIHNAGVVRTREGLLLLVTVESLEGRCSIYPAWSRDGRRFTVGTTPVLTPAVDDAHREYESFGVRDPRITRLDDTTYVTYLAEGDHGFRIGLARTDDFEDFERLGYVSQVDVKNGALFPEKIGGKYVMLERPGDGGAIWTRTSDDLVYWGDGQVVLTPRGGYWDSDRIGAAGPPMKTDLGWLLIYYGVKQTSAGPLFRLGAAMLDLEDPARVIARSNVPVLAPRERYERMGDLPNLVFSCGGIIEEGMVRLYYGASDSCISMGAASVDEIYQACREGLREY